MFALVAELQDAWALAETAWQSLPPSSSQPEGEEAGEGVASPGAAGAAGEQEEQPPFREAVLAASQAWACESIASSTGSGSGSGSGSHAGLLLEVLQGAGPLLEATSLDDFPRLLTWSEGLCGLTLLPLRCVRASPHLHGPAVQSEVQSAVHAAGHPYPQNLQTCAFSDMMPA